ncbi:MAG TPA: DUF222 domain-containing protein [Mycobacteriales bacterium]|nr:DUF222 domain-containing protein [Mycobacteriales bacterium]
MSIDELADGICLRAGRIAAAEAELLAWIAEFDRRGGWSGPGMLSCGHWLSWRTGLSLGTAHERVRVAHRLEELPEVAAAFADGRLSYSKVRAITRVAETGDGVDWVMLGRSSSAAQLEKIVRGVARARHNELAETDPQAAAWPLRTSLRYDEHGNFTLTIRGPAQYAPVVRAGLEAKKAQLQRDRDAAAQPGSDPATRGADPATQTADPADETADPADETACPAGEAGDPADDGPQPAPVTDADALLALTQQALADENQTHPGITRRRRRQLTAHIDPLSGWARQSDGELLPPTSLRTIMKTLPGRDGAVRLRPLTTADLRRHDLGRNQREASAALRELLGTIDGERCRFPGCTRHKKLHAHHVRFWSAGGRTDLDNLVLVCSRHHTLIHTQGFQLVLHPDRRLEVHTADGVPVLHHPALPWGDPADLAAGCGQLISAETLHAQNGDARLDLGYVVSTVLAQAS